jgi:hypothetical protein
MQSSDAFVGYHGSSNRGKVSIDWSLGRRPPSPPPSPLIADVCSKANEGSPCGSMYSGKTCQCTGRRRARNLLFGTLPGASCRCA